MAKGVKKIKWTGKETGVVRADLSKPNEYMTIVAGKQATFTVGEWEAGTNAEDKKKDLTWIQQSEDRKIIINQMTIPSSKLYGFSIPEYLCGKYFFYIEASLGGKPDPKKVGLHVRGYAEPKIVKSKWLFKNKNIKNLESIRYGDSVTLRLETEGLNGYKNIIVDIYNIRPGKDPLIYTYSKVQCINGIITLEINNTYDWYTKLRKSSWGISYKIREEENFYVMVKQDAKGSYIKDNQNDDKHAISLKILNKVSNTQVNNSVNLTPTQIGVPENNPERYESCKFTKIFIIDEDEKDPVKLFDNGQKIKSRNPKKKISRTIYFNFNSSDITPENKKKIDNILLFLLEHEHSTITIDGYACVIGPETYNQKLSQRRSDAIQKIFIDGKLDPKRIISKGRGEIDATDDKKGRDNIKYKDEKNYREARRVDISFTFIGHDASSIIFETTAPSLYSQNEKNKFTKQLTLNVEDMNVNKCFTDSHNRNPAKPITIIDIEQKLSDGTRPKPYPTGKSKFPVYSTLPQIDVLPLKYIIPSLNSPNQFHIHIHSCRYYSENNNPTVVVHAYPDIKWMFSLYMNLSDELSVKWSKLSPAQHKEMQSKAGKIGAGTRWKQTNIKWGVILEAQWNKNGEKYLDKQDATFKYESKIKAFYNIFGGLKEISKVITDVTKGGIRQATPEASYKIEMKPPNFSIGSEWELIRGDVDKVKQPKLGTLLNFFFKAEPLIGLEITIDLLAGLLEAGSTYLSGGSANKVVLKVYHEVKDWAAKAGIDFRMDLIITGMINGEANLEINTQSNTQTQARAELSTRLSIQLIAEIIIEGEYVIVGVKAYVRGQIKASGKATASFGHTLNYKDNKFFYRPKLIFEGLAVDFVLKAEAGLSTKKSWLSWLNFNQEIVDKEVHDIFFKDFDIMEKLEAFTGYSPNIVFLDNN
ncbi:OmpA family protein [Apibacter sp. HY039]|uniref:OmpA family protein n=1 Tax=Apibacter sp. HY039 TaxID=2501476 RepID=UPI000FEB94E2|nr:OmpA family protein [Apibacter sp. HY039]